MNAGAARALLLNLLFGLGVWVGMWNGVAWVGWLVAAFIWTMLTATTCPGEKRRALPLWVKLSRACRSRQSRAGPDRSICC